MLLVEGVLPRFPAALLLAGTAWVSSGLGTAQRRGCLAEVIGAAIAVNRRVDPVNFRSESVAG